jgi:hypothetical protein
VKAIASALLAKTFMWFPLRTSSACTGGPPTPLPSAASRSYTVRFNPPSRRRTNAPPRR